MHGHAVPKPAKVQRARLNRGVWEVLEHWLGQSAADSTWEPLEEFKSTYPDFQLEDELFQKEGGSVVDSFIGKVYNRRKKAPSSG